MHRDSLVSPPVKNFDQMGLSTTMGCTCKRATPNPGYSGHVHAIRGWLLLLSDVLQHAGVHMSLCGKQVGRLVDHTSQCEYGAFAAKFHTIKTASL
jgi:hypothetical protein